MWTAGKISQEARYSQSNIDYIIIGIPNPNYKCLFGGRLGYTFSSLEQCDTVCNRTKLCKKEYNKK